MFDVIIMNIKAITCSHMLQLLVVEMNAQKPINIEINEMTKIMLAHSINLIAHFERLFSLYTNAMK